MNWRKFIKDSFIVLAWLFLITSCSSVSTLQLDVLRPAQYSVAPEIWSVLIVDNAYPYRNDSMHVMITTKDTLLLDSLWLDSFSNIVVSEMEAALDLKAFFDSVYLHPIPLNLPPQGKPHNAVSADSIKLLLNNYDAQALISLESVEYRTQSQLIDLGAFYYVSLDVNANLLWKMYDENGYILDVYLQKDSIFWYDYFNDSKKAVEAIPDFKDAVKTIARLTGQNYPLRIAPWWETVDREYFSAGHHLYQRANDLVKINNWNEAAKIWYHIYESENKKQKARAAYNLALSYEIRNDFQEAKAWAEISRNLFETLKSIQVSEIERKMAFKYFESLNERFAETEALHKQLGDID